MKTITHLTEGMAVNDKINIDDWSINSNNTSNKIKIPSSIKVYIDDIMENTIQRNNEKILFGIASKVKKEKNEKKKKKK